MSHPQTRLRVSLSGNMAHNEIELPIQVRPHFFHFRAHLSNLIMEIVDLVIDTLEGLSELLGRYLSIF